MARELEIRFEAREREIKNGEKKGQKFTAYTAFTKENVKIDMSFVMACPKEPPVEPGSYILHVSSENVNIDKSKRFDRLWVKDFTSIEKIARDTGEVEKLF